MTVNRSTRFLGCLLVFSAPLCAVTSSRAADEPAAAPAASAASTVPAQPVQVDPELLARPTNPNHPPRNLKFVDGHWTPWDPPAVGPNDRVIATGDTLWDLSGTLLGNTWVWPQIWDRNRYIMDSHWIYPGDPLIVPGAPMMVPTEEMTPAEPGEEEQELPYGAGLIEEPVEPPAPVPVALADHHDMQCSSYVDTDFELPDARVAMPDEETKMATADGEVVYINRGTEDGVQVGTEFDAIRPVRNIHRATERKKFGMFVSRLGRLKVVAVEPRTATAEVVDSCSDIIAGDRLIEAWDGEAPIGFQPAPMKRYGTPPSGKASGEVLASDDLVLVVGQGNVIQVDMGSASGFVPGTRVNIYRPNGTGDAVVLMGSGFTSGVDHHVDRDGEYARKFLGTGLVLTARADTSAVKIVESAREIHMGDQVEIQ